MGVSLPDPVPGLVIRYSYPWKAESGGGQEEGVKDRPCAVILVSADDGGDRVVTVLPISRTPPADPELAVELPAATKRRLGLDDGRSWVILTEASCFLWPGPDLRPALPGESCKRCLWIAAIRAIRNHPAAIHRRDPGAPRPDRVAQHKTAGDAAPGPDRSNPSAAR